MFSQTRKWRPSHSGITVSPGMEEIPSLNMPVPRLKVTILPLDLPCSGPVTHSGEILTTGKSHGKKLIRGVQNTAFRQTNGIQTERTHKNCNLSVVGGGGSSALQVPCTSESAGALYTSMIITWLLCALAIWEKRPFASSRLSVPWEHEIRYMRIFQKSVQKIQF